MLSGVPTDPQEGADYERWVQAFAQGQTFRLSSGNPLQFEFQSSQTYPLTPTVVPPVNAQPQFALQDYYGSFADYPVGPAPQELLQGRPGQPSIGQMPVPLNMEQQVDPLIAQHTMLHPQDTRSQRFSAGGATSTPRNEQTRPLFLEKNQASQTTPLHDASPSAQFTRPTTQFPRRQFKFAYYTSPSERPLNTAYQSAETPASSISPPPRTSADDRQGPHDSMSPMQDTSKRASSKRCKRNGRVAAIKRKRQNITLASDSESDSDDEPAPSGSGLPTSKRPTGACTHCRKLKMKCDFRRSEDICRRCKSTGHHCIVEARKHRNAPSAREYLLAQIRQKDVMIDSLLKQLQNPYFATPLSIASYRMATSPSDQTVKNVQPWLERLGPSVHASRQSARAETFHLDLQQKTHTNAQAGGEGEDEDGEELNDRTVRGTNAEEQESDEGAADLVPDDAVPMGLIANLSLSSSKPRKKDITGADEDENDEDDIGWANATYFRPGPAYNLGVRARVIEQNSPPDIVVHGLVTPDDVDALFKIYFDKMNVHINLLDPVLHTPASTFSRCPFLFTVVCAIALRYCAGQSEKYPIAMHFAKHAAAYALITGWKSVELAQAYILLGVFCEPAKRYEEHRGWLYVGLATRIATDLNLHQPSTIKPTTERQERELLNRVRCWLNCYTLDRSTATQYGRPYSIKDDYFICKAASWYHTSKYNGPYDIGICAYVEMLRIATRFHDEIYSNPEAPSGLNTHLNYLELTTTYDNHLSVYLDDWTNRCFRDCDFSDPGIPFRRDLLPYLTNYARLVMYSFGFQQAFRRGMQQEDCIFLDKCYEYASALVTCMVEKLVPSGFMRHASDGHFVFATFASAFLLKLLKPEFSMLVTGQRQNDIFDLIGRLITAFSSEKIAVDDRHTPRLHARFLSTLLSKHRKDVSLTSEDQEAQQVPSTTPSGMVLSDSRQPAEHTSETQDFDISQQPATENAFGDQSMYPEGWDLTTSATKTESSEGDVSMAGSFEDELVGALQVLRTPGYWQSMMMPGFQWSDVDDGAYAQGIPGIGAAYNPL